MPVPRYCPPCRGSSHCFRRNRRLILHCDPSGQCAICQTRRTFCSRPGGQLIRTKQAFNGWAMTLTKLLARQLPIHMAGNSEARCIFARQEDARTELLVVTGRRGEDQGQATEGRRQSEAQREALKEAAGLRRAERRTLYTLLALLTSLYHRLSMAPDTRYENVWF